MTCHESPGLTSATLAAMAALVVNPNINLIILFLEMKNNKPSNTKTTRYLSNFPAIEFASAVYVMFILSLISFTMGSFNNLVL